MGDPGEIARLREELARKSEEVRILREVSSRLNATLDLEEIHRIVLHVMHDLFGFRHSLILSLAEGGGWLEVVAARGYPASAVGARVPVGTGVVGTVAARRQMMRVGNLRQQRAYVEAVRREMEEAGREEDLARVPRLPGLPDAESQVAIPLLIGDRLIGVFSVESPEPATFTERDETLVAIVANLCASALHNAGLFRKERRELQRTQGELSRVSALRAKESGRWDLDAIVGSSRAVRELRVLVRKVARSPASTVLITGENGTGKDLAAKVVHHQSARAAAPFMNITCSALTETLLESELFGHERGAFTDAHRQKRGLLELADGGSVFLDEIGEMSVGLQSKLLRFLEDKAFRRVGGSQDLRVDVRVIAATNRDLPRMVREGAFREDLYYRLRVLPIELPPLRARLEDLPAMVDLFVRQFAADFRKEVRGVDPAVHRELAAYPWPGNVRELRNAVERAVLLAEGPVLEPGDFRMIPARAADAPPGGARRLVPPEGLRFEDLERDLVVEALERAGGNKAAAAKLLGMPRDWLRYRMAKYGLAAGDERDYSRLSRE